MSTMEQDLTPEEIKDVVERGGPWINVTFTSEDGMFEQTRVLTLDQAKDLVKGLRLEIAAAEIKYNTDEVNDERRN